MGHQAVSQALPRLETTESGSKPLSEFEKASSVPFMSTGFETSRFVKPPPGFEKVARVTHTSSLLPTKTLSQPPLGLGTACSWSYPHNALQGTNNLIYPSVLDLSISACRQQPESIEFPLKPIAETTVLTSKPEVPICSPNSFWKLPKLDTGISNQGDKILDDKVKGISQGNPILPPIGNKIKTNPNIHPLGQEKNDNVVINKENNSKDDKQKQNKNSSKCHNLINKTKGMLVSKTQSNAKETNIKTKKKNTKN